MNKSIITGRLTADPELKKTQNGVLFTSFTVASDRPYKNGEERIADFIDCISWRSTAEFICNYFKKGSPIEVEGSIQTRTYEDKEGKKRKITEINADRAAFPPHTKQEENDRQQRFEQKVAVEVEQQNFETVTGDEDLPF